MERLKQARGERHAKPKVLHHLEVKKAENGGHIVTHHFDNSVGGDGYHEPNSHVFGADEGDKALSHIAEHVGIKEPEGEEAKAEEESEEGEHNA